MSRFTFLVRLPETPSDDDLIRMKATRALIESVTGMQSTSGTFSLCGNNQSVHCDCICDCIPRKWLHEAEVLVQQGLISGYEHSGEIEPEEPKEDESINKSEIKCVLMRLSTYYDDRARVALKLMRDSQNIQDAQRHLASALRWETQYETVLRVAENLELELENKEPA